MTLVSGEDLDYAIYVARSLDAGHGVVYISADHGSSFGNIQLASVGNYYVDVKMSPDGSYQLLGFHYYNINSPY